jgi:outer membrane protein assembly factor BamB
MRHVVVLAAIWACSPASEAPPDRGDQEQTEPPPSGLPETDRTGCDPLLDRVDVTELSVEAMPLNGLGRRLTATLGADAGAVVTCALAESPTRLVEVVPADASWRYLDDGADPGPGFVEPGFDDASWQVAPAPFHREQVGTTTLGDVPSWYFRATFDVADPGLVRSLHTSLRYDDGVVVWLNGQEAARLNVPVVETRTGNDELRLLPYSVDPGLLVQGTNTVAVEIHQAEGSVDASFGFRLALELEDLLPETHVVESLAPSATHTLALYGLLADATYACVARSTACEGETATAEIRTEALPVAVPPMAVRQGLETPGWGAYTLFNHQRPCVDEHANRLFIVDPEGRVRWYYELPIDATSSIDIESAWQPDGTIVWGGGDAAEGIPQRLALDGSVLWASSYPGVEGDQYHHDVEVLPNGRIIGLIDSWVRDGEETLDGIGIVEQDPATGEVTWRWDAQEAFDRGELAPIPVDRPGDPWHPNSFAWVSDEDGEGVYVSNLYSNDIIRVDRATGRVLYRLGPGGDFTVGGTWFDHMHAIDVVDGRLFVYDNGWTDDKSRALAYELDLASRHAELVFEYTEPGWYERTWGDADPIGDGHVLINMAHAECQGATKDHHGALVDVREDTGKVVWRVDLLDPYDSSYRSQRLDGCVFANTRYCP